MQEQPDEKSRVFVRGEELRIVAVGSRIKAVEEKVKEEGAVERDEWGLPIQRLSVSRERSRESSQSRTRVESGRTSPLPTDTLKPTTSADSLPIIPAQERGRSRTSRIAREPEVSALVSPVQANEEKAGQQNGNKAHELPPAPAPSKETVNIVNVDDVKPEKKAEDVGKSESPSAEPAVEKQRDESKPPTSVPVSGDVKRQSQIVSALDKSMYPEYDTNSAAAPVAVASEWSHQLVVPQEELESKQKSKEEEDDLGWQEMPIITKDDIYDDFGRLIVKATEAEEEEVDRTEAKKGYTRVNIDEDARSTTSMDENTQYLFPDDVNDDAARDPLSQMEATKDLLTEGQRVAYVGLCRLVLADMAASLDRLEGTSPRVKKDVSAAQESLQMWSQKMMIRLYAHMDISPAEQIMIEQLSEHGVLPSDLTPTLTKNARVKNPMADSKLSTSADTSNDLNGEKSVELPEKGSSEYYRPSSSFQGSDNSDDEDDMRIRNPSELAGSKTLDIDIRWTVLCDLFLVLIADSKYDSRSRVLLEKVAEKLDISWLDICRFEKRVTDALEMQENTQQNWSEEQHMESRRKEARNRRYMMVGLATIGGSLVIGLSGGLLAPVIGAGLVAGFTTIGVGGTGTFLVGTAGTALITSGAVVTGGRIAAKASLNRTKTVSTFEFRPLHNSKRVNLIVTISGWMNGKEDDVRLPFSTVDPIMGDIFSVLWEPDVLQSTGQTMNILATEVLTQTLQQALGTTLLAGALMSALQVPLILSKLSYLLDNPWNVSLDRAVSAGQVLADCLIAQNLGSRPITLVGFSLGARVIWSCLKELAAKRAFGLVQNVYLFGTPVVAKKNDYLRIRSVVSGRFVNGFARNDWILGYLFRATGGGLGRIAGLAPVEEIPGLENVDVTELVDGHMAYRPAIPRLLRKVGWIVVDDEFTEIEEPDPDQHRERQRELIDEIEEARKEAEKKPKKKGFFGLFKGTSKKQAWETYDERKGEGSSSSGGGELTKEEEEQRKRDAHKDDVLFDVEAIRREIAEQTVTAKQEASLGRNSNLERSRSRSRNGSSLYDDYSSGFADTTSSGAAVGVNRYAYDSESEDEFGNKLNKDDNAIQMTFDSGATDQYRPTFSKSVTMPETHSSSTHQPFASEADSWRSPAHSDNTWSSHPNTSNTWSSAQPGVSTKSPSSGYTPAPELERNAWAYDEFEDDWGQEEKEIKMSFA